MLEESVYEGEITPSERKFNISIYILLLLNTDVCKHTLLYHLSNSSFVRNDQQHVLKSLILLISKQLDSNIIIIHCDYFLSIYSCTECYNG